MGSYAMERTAEQKADFNRWHELQKEFASTVKRESTEDKNVFAYVVIPIIFVGWMIWSLSQQGDVPESIGGWAALLGGCAIFSFGTLLVVAVFGLHNRYAQWRYNARNRANDRTRFDYYLDGLPPELIREADRISSTRDHFSN
jgi:hypothetical protein